MCCAGYADHMKQYLSRNKSIQGMTAGPWPSMQYFFMSSTPNLSLIKNDTKSTALHVHVAYQIKGNYECSNMGRKYFACRPPPPQPDTGVGSKFNSFRT